MYHRIASVKALPDLWIEAVFRDGSVKRFDLRPLFSRHPRFRALFEDESLCRLVHVDAGGYGISWNDELDLECEDIWADGVPVPASAPYPDAVFPPSFVAEP